MEKTPKEVRIIGSGFNEMSPDQFSTLAQQLSGLVKSYGLEVQFEEPEAASEPAISMPEIQAENIITQNDLLIYAKTNGFAPSYVNSSWRYLKNRFLDKQTNRQKSLDVTGIELREADECPVEFLCEENDDGLKLPKYLLADSLLPTIKWMFPQNKRYIPSIGPKTREFLIAYANHRLQPDIPLAMPVPVKLEAINIPAENEFRLNQDSPYLEEVQIDEQPVKIVTTHSLKEFSKELNLKPANVAGVIGGFVNSIAVQLGGTKYGPINHNRSKPIETIGDGLISFLKDCEPYWGINPKMLVQIVNKHLSGEQIMKHRSPLILHIVTHYINAINTQSVR